MCLLDSVVSVSLNEIACATLSHRRSDNPLLNDGCLAVINLVEYAAQAAALHQPWLAQEQGIHRPASSGYLAAIRNVKYGRVTDLSQLKGELTVYAKKLMESADGLIYQFEVSVAEEQLAVGRFVIVTGVADARKS
jgi:predicted hotdog family 3-hydroxylacyl-ACP dehydratase